MSENYNNSDGVAAPEKPVQTIDDVKFPPFPDPTDDDFDEDVLEEEKSYYKSKYPDLNEIVTEKLHCTACDRHLGCSARNAARMRSHPMLRTLMCHTCHSFYNSGEFDKGEDGSELYCRWCGQGGQVYCCSDCIHVFCAKCIKRNFGVAKIKEIENTDDWKCFKCNPKCLWDLRAVCWALLRYCDLRNKLVSETEDLELKEKYQKAILIDLSECCKYKGRRREKTDSVKKKEKESESPAKKNSPENSAKKNVSENFAKKNIPENSAKKCMSKIPPTIQVKKFASINLDETPKNEKKAQKRPASPKGKTTTVGFVQKPISIAPSPIMIPPLIKKIRLTGAPLLNPVRFANDKKVTNTYTRVATNRPRQAFPIPIVNTSFNGFNNNSGLFNSVNSLPSIAGDNINLSLETLTQGLDMAAVAGYTNNSSTENDVVCTPDFPLEPLCEVTEDNDDDVECITPGPVVAPKINNPPPLIARTMPDLSSDNILQMTENDVTVNALTGGLKFRVDPQTLSSKKMYRLPDGRIFAINPNPNMPGGYSATIVSVSDISGKVAPKGGETYAAKLSAVAPSSKPSSNSKTSRNSTGEKRKSKTSFRSKVQKSKDTTPKEARKCDLKVPVEWYRYNLIDAVDALDYSLSRLNKLKKEATTAHLRTRTVDEVKYLHRTLEQLLTTSSKRFLEIRENLNKELKLYISRKSNSNTDDISEDDDVEILPDAGNDDPIFIDENSVDSIECNENQEVDLTGPASSEHNDSTENKNYSEPLLCNEKLVESHHDEINATVNSNDSISGEQSPLQLYDLFAESHEDVDKASNKENCELIGKGDTGVEDKENADKEMNKKETQKVSEIEGNIGSGDLITTNIKNNEINGKNEATNHIANESMDVDSNKDSDRKDMADQDTVPTPDLTPDLSEEMIATLLKDDTLEEVGNISNANSLDVRQPLQDEQ